MPGIQKLLADLAADESGAAGDENMHGDARERFGGPCEPESGCRR
jgi:hypothetical protein